MDAITAEIIKAALAEADRADLMSERNHRQPPPSRRSGMTDAQILKLIHSIVDDKLLLTIDTVGGEIGVLHREMDAATGVAIESLRAQVRALTKSVKELRAELVNSPVENSANKVTMLRKNNAIA